MKTFLSGAPIQGVLLFLSLSCLPALGAAQGTVVAWGYGTDGQTDVPATLTNVVDIDAGVAHVLALKADGSVVAWGRNDRGQADFPSNDDIVAISAGAYHNLALTSDGLVLGWGSNSDGQITIPEGLTDVLAVAAGGEHSLVLNSDGTVRVVGGDPLNKTDQVPAGLDNVVAIAANFYQSLALTADGKVHAWGLNTWGESTVPADLDDVVAIDAGEVFSLALKSDGTVVVMGDKDDYFGVRAVPADLTDAVAIAAGATHAVALRADGTVVSWGCRRDCQVPGATVVPAGLSNVTDVAAGYAFGAAVVGVPAEPERLTHTYLGTITSGLGPQADLLPVGTQVIVSPTANLSAIDLNPDGQYGEYEDGVLSMKVEAPTAGFSVVTGTGFIHVGNDYGFTDKSDAVQYYGSNDISGMLGDFPVVFVDFTFLQTVPVGATPTMIDSDAIPTAPLHADTVWLSIVANAEYNTFSLDIDSAPTVAEAVEDAAARIRELMASHRLNAGVGKSLLKKLDLVLASSQANRNSTCGMFTGLSQRVAHFPRRNTADLEVGAELDALLLVLGAALGGCG